MRLSKSLMVSAMAVTGALALAGCVDSSAPVDEPDTFLTGLLAGWESLVAVGSGLLVIAGVLLPWFAVLGVLALVTLLVVRGARRRRGRAAEQAPAAGASTTSA